MNASNQPDLIVLLLKAAKRLGFIDEKPLRVDFPEVEEDWYSVQFYGYLDHMTDKIIIWRTIDKEERDAYVALFGRNWKDFRPGWQV